MEQNNQEYVYGFKGFDSDLKCRGFQFKIGKTYTHEKGLDDVEVCHRGFHYCLNLKDVRQFYSFNPNIFSGNKRFCVVKAKYHHGTNFNQNDKSVTDEITIVEEIPFEKIQEFDEFLNDRNKLEPSEIFRLDDVKIIQTAYPHFILGGSSALFLHGFNIKRNVPIGDLDLITPYYTPVRTVDFKPEDNVTEADNMADAKPSGNDFDYVEGIVSDGQFLLLDMKIDPKQRYEIINFDGFDFKVSPWLPIIEAKMKYINSWSGAKHKKDMVDIFQLVKPGKREIVNPIDSIMNKYK